LRAEYHAQGSNRTAACTVMLLEHYRGEKIQRPPFQAGYRPQGRCGWRRRKAPALPAMDGCIVEEAVSGDALQLHRSPPELEQIRTDVRHEFWRLLPAR